jgi:hypothetical protein
VGRVAVAGLLICVVTGCSLAQAPAPVWDEAERAVSALPVPGGYRDAGLSRQGGEGDESCGSPAGCAAPSVTRTFEPSAPISRAESCEKLRETLPTWIAAGYQFDRWYESAGDGLRCSLAGSMNGLDVGAQVTSSGEIRLSALAVEKR